MTPRNWFSVLTKILGLFVLLRAAESLVTIALIKMRSDYLPNPNDPAWMLTSALGCAVGFGLIRHSQWVERLSFGEVPTSSSESQTQD